MPTSAFTRSNDELEAQLAADSPPHTRCARACYKQRGPVRTAALLSVLALAAWIAFSAPPWRPDSPNSAPTPALQEERRLVVQPSLGSAGVVAAGLSAASPASCPPCTQAACVTEVSSGGTTAPYAASFYSLPVHITSRIFQPCTDASTGAAAADACACMPRQLLQGGRRHLYQLVQSEHPTRDDATNTWIEMQGEFEHELDDATMFGDIALRAQHDKHVVGSTAHLPSLSLRWSTRESPLTGDPSCRVSASTTSFFRSPFGGEACPNYVQVNVDHTTGLGHRMLNVGYALYFAFHFNLTYVHQRLTQKGFHGAYPHADTLFGIQADELTRTMMEHPSMPQAMKATREVHIGKKQFAYPTLHTEQELDQWAQEQELREKMKVQPCHTLYTFPEVWYFPPPFHFVHLRTKMLHRWRLLREKNHPVYQFYSRPELIPNPATLSVGVHMRGTDRSANFDWMRYTLDGVLEQLLWHSDGPGGAALPLSLYLASEDPAMITRLTSPEVTRVRGAEVHVLDPAKWQPLDVVYMLARCDVLITSQSGFSHLMQHVQSVLHADDDEPLPPLAISAELTTAERVEFGFGTFMHRDKLQQQVHRFNRRQQRAKADKH